MSKQQETKPRHRPGQVSYPAVLNHEDLKCYGQAIAVCEKRNLVAIVLAVQPASVPGDVALFRYRATTTSSFSSSSFSSSSSSSATAASGGSSSSPINTTPSSSNYEFEKLSSANMKKSPWSMVFGEHYLFVFGELEERIGVIDLKAATSASEEDREESEVQFSTFGLPAGYSCEYTYEATMNASRTKLAFVTLSFFRSGNQKDFNGIVILDVNKYYDDEVEEKVPEENAFSTVSAIMDDHDEETQAGYGVEFSIIDDGARIAYLSGDRLKVCDVAAKEKTFELDLKQEKDNVQKNESCFCLFHPTEPNLVLLARGGKVRFYDVKAKTKLREFNLFASSQTKIRGMYFPAITSESRYLLASLYDKGEGAEEKNWRLGVVDTVDGTVIQSTPLPANSLIASSPFLSYNTMLFSEEVSGAFIVKGIAVCLWNSRKPVFLIREKSSLLNRIAKVLNEEWVVLRNVSKFVA